MVVDICKDCNHSTEDNPHGFDQNDGRLDENNQLIHSGQCTYCKECNPNLREKKNELI